MIDQLHWLTTDHIAAFHVTKITVNYSAKYEQ